MRITDLLKEEAISLQAVPKSKEEAMDALIELQEKAEI